MKKQQSYVSFSLKGTSLFLLVMLPNILFFSLSDSSLQTALHDKSVLLSAFQYFIQILLIFMLVAVRSLKEGHLKDKRVIWLLILLVLYYIMWIPYFFGGMDYSIVRNNIWLSLGMAIVPSIYFYIAELWLANKIGSYVALLFGIVHVLNTLLNTI